MLALIVSFYSMLNAYLTVYATGDEESGGGGGTSFDKDPRTWYEKLDEFLVRPAQGVSLLLCQIGAVRNGDYLQMMENFNSFIYNDDGTINTDVVSYDEATDSITMDCSSLITSFAGQLGLSIAPAVNDTKDSAYNYCLSVYGNRKDVIKSDSGWGNFSVYCIDFDRYYIIFSGRESKYFAYDKSTLEKVNGAFTYYHHANGNSPVTYVSEYDYAPTRTGFYNLSFMYWSSLSMLQRFVNGSTYLGSSFGQDSTITIPVADLEKDWAAAYDSIVKELDDIKETTGERPTQKQIDDAIKKVLDELGDIGGDIGDIGGDIEEVAKTLDDIYKLLEKCHAALEGLGGSLSGGAWSEEDVRTSLGLLEQVNTNLSKFDADYLQQNKALFDELEEVSRLLSDALYDDSGQDIAGLLSKIDLALQDLSILMQDRLLALLEDLLSSSGEMGDNIAASNGLLEQIKGILEAMSGNDVDTSKLEEALEEIRASIADAGAANSQDLSGLKDLLSDMQSVLIDIKSGIASQNDYTEALEKIYALLGDIYKVQKLGTALDVADLLLDFSALLDDGDTTFLDKMGTSLSNVANASKEHFPTSIPWDLVALFTAFRTEAVAPSYDLPFSIPALGVSEVITIDLTGFEGLSRASRALLSALFLLLLVHLTRKSTAPDEGDG